MEYWCSALVATRRELAQLRELAESLAGRDERWWRLYERCERSEAEVERLRHVAHEALRLLRCERDFSEDLTITPGNVVRCERVVRLLEEALGEGE
jgi:hypothetical protein